MTKLTEAELRIMGLIGQAVTQIAAWTPDDTPVNPSALLLGDRSYASASEVTDHLIDCMMAACGTALRLLVFMCERANAEAEKLGVEHRIEPVDIWRAYAEDRYSREDDPT